MIYVVLVLQVVTLATMGVLFKVFEEMVRHMHDISGDFKGVLVETLTGNLNKVYQTLNQPEVRHHLTKNVDARLVKERRQMMVRESRK